MKRLILILLALVAGGFFFVLFRHNGNVVAAWAAISGQISEASGTSRGGATRARQSEPGTEAAAQPGGSPGRGRGQAQGQGQGAPVPVLTARAEQQDLPITRTSVGWIEPIATVTVRARIDGQIIEQRAKDGDMVKAGDVLFHLDDREIQAQIARDQASLDRDKATLAKAQADLKRAEELITRNVGSQAQVEQLGANVKVAAATVAGSEAAVQADRIKLGYTTVKAPIEGRLGTVRITEGNLVRGSDSSGDGLVTITQMTPLRVSFTLPERDLPLLRTALNDPQHPAQVRLYPSNSDQLLGTGELSFVDSTVDLTSGTIQAKATLPNKDGTLWPGQYVRVEAQLGMRPNVVLVPLVAVQPGQDSSHLFVVKDDRTVEMRKVQVAETPGDRAVIAQGVAPGDRIVVEGQLRLRNGSRVIDKNPGPAADGAPRTAEAQRGVRQ
jgi:multidrug efflux system membrane fusion protein